METTTTLTGFAAAMITDGMSATGKSGARNSAQDAARLKRIRDLAAEIANLVSMNGVDDPTENETLTEAAQVSEDMACAKALDMSYVKAIGLDMQSSALAVKAVSTDEIQFYAVLFGDESKTDIERDYFTRSTDFWLSHLTGAKPLTWDHALDQAFKSDPVIGTITSIETNDIGLWATATLDRAHRYRKALDKLIAQGALGASSDSAPQYVLRSPTGKSHRIDRWPLLSVSLTPTPAEPRMLAEGSPVWKSISFPEFDYLKLCYDSLRLTR